MTSMNNLAFLLNGFTDSIREVRWAVCLSADGLQLARSAGLSPDTGDSIAAVASGVRSLARGAAQHMDGGMVRQTIIEMDHGYLFVAAIGEGACLAVAAGADADVGLVAFEMARLVTRAGQALVPQMRPAAAV